MLDGILKCFWGIYLNACFGILWKPGNFLFDCVWLLGRFAKFFLFIHKSFFSHWGNGMSAWFGVA